MLNELIFGIVAALVTFHDDVHLTSLKYNSSRQDYLIWDQHKSEKTARYYIPEHTDFSIDLGSSFVVADNIIFNSHLIYLSSNSAPAITVPSALNISMSVDIALHQNTYWSLGIDNFLTLSRNNQDFACVDSFQREFHCATELPFSDTGQFRTRRKAKPILLLSRTWLF